MTNSYDFDKTAKEERPLIIMGGYRYNLRYPTVEDIERIQKLETDEQRTDALYQFIEPQEGAAPFKDVLMKQDIRVLRQFSEMIKVEFGVEG